MNLRDRCEPGRSPAATLALMVVLPTAVLLGGCSGQRAERQQRALTGVPPTLASVYAFRKPLQCAARLLAAADGSLYGLACGGGAFGNGALFQRQPDGSLVTLHDFTGGDGAEPGGRLASASDGTFYGATRAGGANGVGTLFQYAAGTLTTLFHFSTADARYPSQVIVGSNGALYGTTEEGGSSGYGTLFKWSASTGLVILQSFDPSTGSYPYAGVIEGSDGAFYGTCDSDGAKHRGTLWRWQAASGLTILHAFSGGGDDGANPFRGGVVEGSDGAFYGTTSAGGTLGYGTLFRWSASAGFATVRSFNYDTEGGYLVSGVIQGSDGALYGTASAGGSGHRGTVFRWTAAGLTVLHAFSDTADIDGALPSWGITQGSDGTLYGTTESGGAGNGVLFQLGTSGTPFAVLHRLGEAEIVGPGGRIAVASDGSLYGTSREGGAYGQGTVFRVASGVATILHSFDWDFGATPEAGLVLGSDGAFYGTTGQGASGCGTLFRWLDGTGLSTLHVLDWSASGCYPAGGVIQASDGAYYGTTAYGGASNGGTIFRWNGTFTNVHDFAPDSEGAGPSYNGLVQGSDGAFYGTTGSGGPGGGGTLFRWDGTLTVLYAFSTSGSGGWSPAAGVIRDSDGALYGTTSAGGAAGLGTLFRWSSAVGLATLHAFAGSDGQNPYLPLLQRPDRMIYGVADTATAGYGLLFQWDPVASTFDRALTIAPNMGSSLSAWLANAAGDTAYGTTWEGGPAGGGALFRLSFTSVDPCAANHGGCDVHATCANDNGVALCTCTAGYQGSGIVCTDIDECLAANGGCDVNATCTNTPGARTCTCHAGYAGSGVTCTDINECLTGNGGCDAHATCTNTVGARTCACNPGYLGDGITCTPVALATIQVTPTHPSIAKGTTLQFTATGIYTDSSMADLTTQVTWSSSATSVATISNTPGAQGRATAVNVGSTTITATSGSISGTTTLTITAAVLSSIQVTPTNASIAKGTTRQYTATGIYSDSTTQNLTTQVTWSSAATAIATLSNTAGSQGNATAVNVGSTTITATSGSISGTTTLTVTAATLSSIQVTPTNVAIAKGTTAQYTATGIYSDSTTQNLTTQVTWSSSATAVATISNTAGSQGRAAGAGVGSTTITATSGSISGTTTLTVTTAVLTSIQVTPTGASLAKGNTRQYTAAGSYSDSSVQDITAQVTWSSSAISVATVSNAVGSKGLATAVAMGSTTISATLASITNSTGLTVTAAVLTSIQVTPDGASIANGTTLQYTATGIYSDSTTQDITTQVTWTSTSPAMATISNAAGSQGLADSLSLGSTSIRATSGSVSDTTSLTVTAATLDFIEVQPVDPTVAKGTVIPFVVVGTYTDDSTQDLTEAATWISSEPSVVAVSNAAGSKGRATTLAVGTSTITAVVGSVSDYSDATVTPATLLSIAVTPTSPSIPDGTTQQLTATGTYSDTTTQDITAQVTWSSSATAVATISNTTGSQGRATAVAAGSTTITATLDTTSGTAVLNVTAAVLNSITVTPASPRIARTYKVQFTATGNYSDGSTQNLTTSATWTSSSTSVATISNAAGSNGLGTVGSTATGSTTITATYGGTSGSTTLTATTATLSSIAVTPTGPIPLVVGQTVQLTATGTFSDGTKLDLTRQATWRSSRNRNASVNTTGLVKGVRARSSNVTITATKSSRSGSTTVRVSNP